MATHNRPAVASLDDMSYDYILQEIRHHVKQEKVNGLNRKDDVNNFLNLQFGHKISIINRAAELFALNSYPGCG